MNIGQTKRATVREKVRACGVVLATVFLPDMAADAEFERMIERLRSAPGTNKRGKQ